MPIIIGIILLVIILSAIAYMDCQDKIEMEEREARYKECIRNFYLKGKW